MLNLGWLNVAKPKRNVKPDLYFMAVSCHKTVSPPLCPQSFSLLWLFIYELASPVFVDVPRRLPFSMTCSKWKWQNSKDSIEPFLPHTCMNWMHCFCLLLLKSSIVTKCNFFFREQLNSLLKTYNIFYGNQKNLHILYGQVSPSKKYNTVWFPERNSLKV